MQTIIDQLIEDEGLRVMPYYCTAGKLTIGVGRNLEDRGISRPEALYLLNNDIANCNRELDESLPWWRGMNQVRQNVLINMCFNLGINKLLKFRNTLAAMERGDYAAASVGMLASKWAGQVGQRAVRLAKQMREGE